jgi:Na+/pantothenate symporter
MKINNLPPLLLGLALLAPEAAIADTLDLDLEQLMSVVVTSVSKKEQNCGRYRRSRVRH